MDPPPVSVDSSGRSMLLDPRSITAAGTLTTLVVSLVGVLLWQSQRTYAGFGRWTLGNLCAAASLVFLYFRGAIPDSVSVMGTNAFVFLAAVLLFEGTRDFLGLRPRSWPAWLLAVCCLLAELYFLVGANQLSARILVASACLCPLELFTGAHLIKARRKGRELGYWFTGSLFLANGALNLTRGIVTLVHWPVADILHPSLLNQVYFLGMVITVVGWAFGFVMLTKDRLVDDLVAAEQRTNTLNQELAAAMERATQAARLATKADEAKTEFLAQMSHEIRTPLNGVLGLTELVLDGPLTEDKREDLTAARDSAYVLLGIVNDILDLSKIEAGELTVTTEPFDLHQELHQILTLYGPRAAAKSTGLRVKYPEDLPRWFAGDQMRVTQIIANFTSNAVKFTDAGEIELGVTWENQAVRIWVHDTGIGIAPETLPRLFTKFTQADTSTARNYGGTGLGLAISKHLAELMGGRVGATSSPGLGSTFWVELALEPATPPAELTVRDRRAGWGVGGLHVLVAEDNAVNQRLIVKLLEKQGLTVDVATNGLEAVSRNAQTEYAAVLMDCQMPEMDGYEATRAIRQQERGTGRHTPIIAITANALLGDQDRCRAAGMDGYLTKPIQSAELMECIAEHCVARLRSSVENLAEYCAHPVSPNGVKGADQLAAT
jgi:signal transduction histidine kinase/ActR/RegA family two-component response regulator